MNQKASRSPQGEQIRRASNGCGGLLNGCNGIFNGCGHPRRGLPAPRPAASAVARAWAAARAFLN